MGDPHLKIASQSTQPTDAHLLNLHKTSPPTSVFAWYISCRLLRKSQYDCAAEGGRRNSWTDHPQELTGGTNYQVFASIISDVPTTLSTSCNCQKHQ